MGGGGDVDLPIVEPYVRPLSKFSRRHLGVGTRELHPSCSLRPVRWSGPRARRHGVQLVCVVFPGRSGGPEASSIPRHLDRDDCRANERRAMATVRRPSGAMKVALDCAAATKRGPTEFLRSRPASSFPSHRPSRGAGDVRRFRNGPETLPEDPAWRRVNVGSAKRIVAAVARSRLRSMDMLVGRDTWLRASRRIIRTIR